MPRGHGLDALVREHPELRGPSGADNVDGWVTTVERKEAMADTEQVAFRLPKDLVARLDDYAARLAEEQPGMSFTRTDVVRVLLTEGTRWDRGRDTKTKSCAPPIVVERRAPRSDAFNSCESSKSSKVLWILARVSPKGHIQVMVFRVARLVLGIPSAVLAERAGISSKELGRIERGEVHPRRETLAALNNAFASLVAARLGARDEEVSA